MVFLLCYERNKKICENLLTIVVNFVKIPYTVRACTGFDRPAEDGEAIRGLRPR